MFFSLWEKRVTLAVLALGFSIFSGEAVAVDCDVAIIGGGAAGVHTAYQLVTKTGHTGQPASPGKVCLFEKNSYLGGRIKDVKLNEASPSVKQVSNLNGGTNKVFGTGALRFDIRDYTGSTLRTDLGIEIDELSTAAQNASHLINARGKFGYFSDDFVTGKNVYPYLESNVASLYGFGTEDYYWNKFLCDDNVYAATASALDWRSHVRSVAGVEAYHFLTDTFRFRGDFERTLDARSYTDFNREEFFLGEYHYPVGGMSEFILRMRDRVNAIDPNVFSLNSAVTSVTGSAGNYTITFEGGTTKTAGKVVLAVDPEALKHITGTPVEAIKDSTEFKATKGIKVVTVDHKWSEPWWNKAADYKGKNIDRVWTTEHCLNFIWTAEGKTPAAENFARTVYDDGIRCIEFWENTYANGGINAVNEEVLRGLRYLFPSKFKGPGKEPTILSTHYQSWPAGWYLLNGGSYAMGVTNQSIETWAAKPLYAHDIYLASDGYYPQRLGWSDGAYKSSINVLNTNFGFNIPKTSVVGTEDPAGLKAQLCPWSTARAKGKYK